MISSHARARDFTSPVELTKILTRSYIQCMMSLSVFEVCRYDVPFACKIRLPMKSSLVHRKYITPCIFPEMKISCFWIPYHREGAQHLSKSNFPVKPIFMDDYTERKYIWRMYFQTTCRSLWRHETLMLDLDINRPVGIHLPFLARQKRLELDDIVERCSTG